MLSVSWAAAWRIMSLSIFASCAVASAQAADFVPVGFQTPSGNIFCQAFSFEKDESLRCDVMQLTGRTPAKPKDCDYDWGQAFALDSKAGEGQRICYSDTTMDHGLAVLPYGMTWQQGSFTCISDRVGLTCLTAARHGFVLSKAEQRLF